MALLGLIVAGIEAVVELVSAVTGAVEVAESLTVAAEAVEVIATEELPLATQGIRPTAGLWQLAAKPVTGGIKAIYGGYSAGKTLESFRGRLVDYVDTVDEHNDIIVEEDG